MAFETRGVRFDIANPGRFEVVAMVEDRPPTRAHLKQLKLAGAWPGRAVSKPITVEIGAASARGGRSANRRNRRGRIGLVRAVRAAFSRQALQKPLRSAPPSGKWRGRSAA